MVSPERPSDQRTTYRCVVPPELQDAELHVGQRTISVLLVDESVGGFSVLVRGEVGLEVGQTLVLRNCAGWFESRIANVQPIDSPDAHLVPGAATYRLGLVRLRELQYADDLVAPPAEKTAKPEGAAARPGSSLRNILVVAGLVLAPALLAFVQSRFGDTALVQTVNAHTVGVVQSWLSFERSPAVVVEKAAATMSEALEGASAAAGDAATQLSKDVDWKSLRRKIEKLSLPEALTLPTVAEGLKLNRLQSEQLGEIARLTAAALKHLESSQDANAAGKREVILQAARQRTLDLLDAQQRSRWSAIAGE